MCVTRVVPVSETARRDGGGIVGSEKGFGCEFGFPGFGDVVTLLELVFAFVVILVLGRSMVPASCLARYPTARWEKQTIDRRHLETSECVNCKKNKKRGDEKYCLYRNILQLGDR